MRELFEFLSKQDLGFWTRGLIIFIIASLVLMYILSVKFKVSLKGNLITSLVIVSIFTCMVYSFGFKCYKGYNAPKDKMVLIDLDKGFQESVLNVLKIKYEVRK